MRLDAAQLASADPGAYGSIHATLAHIFSVDMFTQAAVHATEHRTNITTTLTKMGFKEFDLSAWAFFASLM
jgi:uncharacterized damage-inducible protein DinB